MMPLESREEASEALQQLSLLQVAKNLFLSRWFEDAVEDFFEGEDLATMRRIAEESRQELEATMDIAHRWAESLDDQESQGPLTVARATRHDFLRTLVEGKEAAWDVYELAARVAPPEFREDLLELGAIDLRHASELRAILSRLARERADDLLGAPARRD